MTPDDYPRTRLLLRIGFWITFAVCCYYAFDGRPSKDLGFDVSDIATHGLAFVVLTSLLLGAYLHTQVRHAIAWMLLYAVCIELVQTQLPDRQAEVKDLIVDAIGIAIGVLAYRWLSAWGFRTFGRFIG